MKINGTIFSKPQQDQLKHGIGAELDKVVAKVDDVDKRMLNYVGDWVSGNEYHENDVVTWGTDGHLYEVIKAHTSSATFDPDNPEYYKAMTATKYIKHTYTTLTNDSIEEIINIFKKTLNGKNVLVCEGFVVYQASLAGSYCVATNVSYSEASGLLNNLLIIERGNPRKIIYTTSSTGGISRTSNIGTIDVLEEV